MGWGEGAELVEAQYGGDQKAERKGFGFRGGLSRNSVKLARGASIQSDDPRAIWNGGWRWLGRNSRLIRDKWGGKTF